MPVDDLGRCPFGQAVVVDPAAPAPAEELGVVVTAEQGEIVEVGESAFGPAEDVVPFAIFGRGVAPGKATSSVPSDERHGLSEGGDSAAAAEVERHTFGWAWW